MKFILSANRKLLLYMALLLIVKSDLLAQDPHFSQFFANPVYTNPAFAGSSNHGRFVSNARNQWSSISGTFITMSAAYDENFSSINGGLGLMLTRDQAGIGLLTTNSASLAYSYLIPVNRYLTFRASVQAGIIQKTLDFGNFTWGDQILKQYGIVKPVTGESATSPSLLIPNFAAGFLAYTKTFYGGVALHNLTEPQQGFWTSTKHLSVIQRRITAHAGMQIPLTSTGKEFGKSKNSTGISPNVLFMQQGPYTEVNAGMYYVKGSYVLGGYFRQTSANTDALILLLGLRREKMRIGISYDATLSNARPGATGSWEVSLAFEMRKRVPKPTTRTIRCPEF